MMDGAKSVARSFICSIAIATYVVSSVAISLALFPPTTQAQDASGDLTTLDRQLAEARRQIDHLEELGIRKAKNPNISIIKAEGQWLAIDREQIKGKFPALATVIHAILSDSPTAQEAVGSRFGDEKKKTVHSAVSQFGLGEDMTNSLANLAGMVASEVGRQAAANGHISQEKLEGQMAKEFDKWVKDHSVSSETLVQEQVRWSNRYQELDKHITKTLQEEQSVGPSDEVAKKLETELENLHNTFFPIRIQVNAFHLDLWEAQKPLKDAPRAEDVTRLDKVAQEIRATTQNIDALTTKLQDAGSAYSNALLAFSKVSDHVRRTQSEVCRKAQQATRTKEASLDSLQQLGSDAQRELQDRQNVLDVTYENVKRKGLAVERSKVLLAELRSKTERFRRTEKWDSLDRLQQALDNKRKAESLLEEAKQRRTRLPEDYEQRLGTTIAVLQRISTVANAHSESLDKQNAEPLRDRFVKIRNTAAADLYDVKTLPKKLPKVPTLHDALAAQTDIALIAFEKLPELIQLVKVQQKELKGLEERAKSVLETVDADWETVLGARAYQGALEKARGCYAELVRLIEASETEDSKENPSEDGQRLAEELRDELDRIRAEKAQYDQRYAFIAHQIPLLFRTLAESVHDQTKERNTYPPRGNPLIAKVKAAFDAYRTAHATFDAFRTRLTQARAETCRSASASAKPYADLEPIYTRAQQTLRAHATQLQSATSEIDARKSDLLEANRELLAFSNDLEVFLTSLTNGMTEATQKARAIHQQASDKDTQAIGGFSSATAWWAGVQPSLSQIARSGEEKKIADTQAIAQEARGLLKELHGKKIKLTPLREYVALVTEWYSIPELLKLRHRVKEHLELGVALQADGTMNKLEALDNLEQMKACTDTLHAGLQRSRESPSDDLLGGFPEDPDDSSPSDSPPLTAAQRQAAEEFGQHGPTSELPTQSPTDMVSADSDDSPPLDVADAAQTERDREREKDKKREQARRNKDEEEQQRQQETNRQNEEDRQGQDQAARDRRQRVQEQGQSRIDDARNAPDPLMSASDMAQRAQAIDDKTDAATAQIDQDITTLLTPGVGNTRPGTSSTSPSGSTPGWTQGGTSGQQTGVGGATRPQTNTPTGTSAPNARCQTFVRQGEQHAKKMRQWTRAYTSAKSLDERKRLASEHQRLARESIRIYDQARAAGCASALPQQSREALESVRQQLGSPQAPMTPSSSPLGSSKEENIPCDPRVPGTCSSIFGLD